MKEKSTKKNKHRFRPAHLAHEIPEEQGVEGASAAMEPAPSEGPQSGSKSIFEQVRPRPCARTRRLLTRVAREFGPGGA
jgi:hypothetical protein